MHIKIIIATLCAFVALMLPSDVSKPVEAGTYVPKAKAAIQPLQAIKHTPAAQLGLVTVEAPRTSVNTSDAKMFIYMHESGNNPAAVNSIGCRGLGQACPGSKLPCGNEYACQDAWFTSYMQGRYGSWENAKAFWLQNKWW